jgi:hypothetical protein
MLSGIVSHAPRSIALRATSKGVKTIDRLHPDLADCVDLYLSHNNISSIHNIVQFRVVVRVMLEYNLIQFVEDLRPLSQLERLEELRLEGNPVCHCPFWRYHTISFCKVLKWLNCEEVNRDDANLARVELSILDSLFYTDFVLKILRAIEANPAMTQKQIAQLIQDEMARANPQEFNNAIRSKCETSSHGDYLKILQEMCLSKQSEIARIAPYLFHDNPEQSESLGRTRASLAGHLNYIKLASAMRECAAFNLSMVGFGGTSPASLVTNPIDFSPVAGTGRETLREIADRAFDICNRPPDQIDHVSNRPFVWSKSREIARDLVTVDDAESLDEVQYCLSEYGFVGLDSRSVVEYHKPFTMTKRHRLVIEAMHSDSDEDDRYDMGLTFNAQVERELTGTSSRAFSESFASFPFVDTSSPAELSSAFNEGGKSSSPGSAGKRHIRRHKTRS